jgi:RNA polymerase sigma-70 factor (ECF subfamily)
MNSACIVRPAPGSRWLIAVDKYVYAHLIRAVHSESHQAEVSDDQQRISTTSTPNAEEVQDRQFEHLFVRYHQDIFSYVWRITGDEQAAHDLCQETFLRAWQHFTRLSTYERPGAWLFRVATNLAINHQRNQAKSVSRLLKLEEPGDTTETESDPALGVVERDAVATAMRALPLRQRMALVLRVVYGLPFEEIALTLGVSHAAAKMTLSRARDQFRRHYLQVQPGSQHH